MYVRLKNLCCLRGNLKLKCFLAYICTSDCLILTYLNLMSAFQLQIRIRVIKIYNQKVISYRKSDFKNTNHAQICYCDIINTFKAKNSVKNSFDMNKNN